MIPCNVIYFDGGAIFPVGLCKSGTRCLGNLFKIYLKANFCGGQNTVSEIIEFEFISHVKNGCSYSDAKPSASTVFPCKFSGKNKRI